MVFVSVVGSDYYYCMYYAPPAMVLICDRKYKKRFMLTSDFIRVLYSRPEWYNMQLEYLPVPVLIFLFFNCNKWEAE